MFVMPAPTCHQLLFIYSVLKDEMWLHIRCLFPTSEIMLVSFIHNKQNSVQFPSSESREGRRNRVKAARREQQKQSWNPGLIPPSPACLLLEWIQPLVRKSATNSGFHSKDLQFLLTALCSLSFARLYTSFLVVKWFPPLFVKACFRYN